MSQAHAVHSHLGLLNIQERVRVIKVIHAAKNEASNDLDDMKLLSGNRRIGRLFKFRVSCLHSRQF